MTEPLRVLIVEDSPTDAKLVVRELRRGGHEIEFERVEDAASMRAALTEKVWDVVISDWSLPRFGALAARKTLHDVGLDLPFIIVSGTMGEEFAVDAMRAGAHDFVLKDKLARLAPSVERELRERRVRGDVRRGEESLRLQEARFRALIEKSADAIALTGMDGAFLYVSPSMTRMLGYGADDLIGTCAIDRVHPEDRQRVADVMAHIRRTESASVTAQFRVVRPDDTCVWLEATVTNMLSEPAVGAIVSNVRDITERRRAMEDLAASEARYRRIIETTNEGVWTLDADGLTTFVNARMAAMLGYDAKELIGMPILPFVDEEWRAATMPDIARLRAGAVQQTEGKLKRKDGATVWVLIEASPIFDESGRFEGAFGMLMDVTARRTAEEALRVSEARFSKLAESGIIGIVVGDHDGNILETNDAFLGMLGYSREDFLAKGLDWRAMTPAEHQVRSDRALEELGAHGMAAPFEKDFLRKDGHRLPVLMGLAKLTDSHSIAFIADLTAQKRAEEALRQSEEQLRQAQKMEAVGRLAGGVAHDFNNMLSVVLTNAELVLGELKQGDPLREDVQEIQKAGKRAADLTRQLLMFSRQQVIEPKVLDLNDVLVNLDKMLQRILGEDVDLVSRHTSSSARVRVDASHIEQVIMNLVVNARDAMPTGGHLTIETASVVFDEDYAQGHFGVAAGPHVMLAVSDTGTGMDKETQARIFEPFFTTKETGKGTGLGLSTVFGIVKQCGGSIWVYSEPGKGTTFKIYLPMVDAPLDQARPQLAAVTLRGSETVLLVEDEDLVRTAARTILRRNGYDVIEARNGGEALMICEKHPGTIHLLLTDVVMPLTSGPELAKRLLQERPTMKVLCMSGYTDDSIVRHGVLEGHMAFLQKPITPDTLGRKVRQVLDEGGGNTPLSSEHGLI